MLWDIAQSNHVGPFHPTHASDQSATLPGIYSVKSRSGTTPVALFKPSEEETFVRDGLHVGEGTIREEAAYLLDAIAGGYSRVPPTTVATLHLRLKLLPRWLLVLLRGTIAFKCPISLRGVGPGLLGN